MAELAGSAAVVVIGSGGLGAATAFSLARRGIARIVLIDMHAIGSQTSPRAAGMVSCVRKSDLMTSLIMDAAARITRFGAETGQPLDWVRSGSLKVARRPEDDAVLEGDLARGRRLGLDVERLSPQHAQRLQPFLEPAGVLGVLRIGDDMYFDPAQLAIGYARAAEALGVTLMPHTRVRRVVVEGGQVLGVETEAGVLQAPLVVDAAGAWTRQVAQASGIAIPLAPTRHQLFVTAPVAGAHATLPMVRIMDAAVYLRPCQGGFLWGVFEEEPQFLAMDALGDHFDMRDLPLDAAVLQRAARAVEEQLPVLQTATVREHRGGIPTMTADGQHIVGPAPEVRGFYFASGCNVAGLSIAPALGDALAAWIVDGAPPVDLTPLSVERFRAHSWSEAELQQQAAWQYRHFYGAV
jgi:4-methylaminobutanoate oxidase (formaldehyde-forming)